MQTANAITHTHTHVHVSSCYVSLDNLTLLTPSPRHVSQPQILYHKNKQKNTHNQPKLFYVPPKKLFFPFCFFVKYINLSLNLSYHYSFSKASEKKNDEIWAKWKVKREKKETNSNTFVAVKKNSTKLKKERVVK